MMISTFEILYNLSASTLHPLITHLDSSFEESNCVLRGTRCRTQWRGVNKWLYFVTVGLGHELATCHQTALLSSLICYLAKQGAFSKLPQLFIWTLCAWMPWGIFTDYANGCYAHLDCVSEHCEINVTLPKSNTNIFTLEKKSCIYYASIYIHWVDLNVSIYIIYEYVSWCDFCTWLIGFVLIPETVFFMLFTRPFIVCSREVLISVLLTVKVMFWPWQGHSNKAISPGQSHSKWPWEGVCNHRLYCIYWSTTPTGFEFYLHFNFCALFWNGYIGHATYSKKNRGQSSSWY